MLIVINSDITTTTTTMIPKPKHVYFYDDSIRRIE